MKKIILIPLLFIISISLAQQKEYDAYKKEISRFQKKLNNEFKDPQESPFSEDDLKNFKSLDFFPVDTNFRVTAKVIRTRDSKPFQMKTNTERLPLYTVYAIVSFKLNGKTYELPVYQNQKLMQTPEYKDYLFLPFTDLTNGKSTYGGGRYLDLEIPEGNTMIIDFNKAYNPYCAYNEKYSCPIPPQKNHLDTAIRAGVKKFKEH